MKTQNPAPRSTSRSQSGLGRLGALCAVGLAFLLGAPSAQASLLPNGDFEAATRDPAWPDHWGKAKEGAVTWEEEQGNRFLRMRATDANQMILIYREVSIPANTKAIEVSARVRVSGLVKGPQSWFDSRIMIEVRDGERKKLPGGKNLTVGRDTDGWETRSVKFAVTEGGSILAIMPALFRVNAGTFDLDDIVVRPIDPSEL